MQVLFSYTTQYGKLIEFFLSLQIFFDGVQAKVSQGVKESEIGYQMAFSKHLSWKRS